MVKQQVLLDLYLLSIVQDFCFSKAMQNKELILFTNSNIYFNVNVMYIVKQITTKQCTVYFCTGIMSLSA